MDRSQHLHIDRHYSAFVGNFGFAEHHRHGAMALLTALSGTIRVASHAGIADCRSVLIDAHVAHSVDCGDEYVSTLYVEPDSPLCAYLRHQYLQHADIAFDILPTRLITASTRDLFLGADLETLTGRAMKPLASSLDHRVLSCLQIIRETNRKVVDRQSIAQGQNLSVSRFSRLFREQTAVSFQRYKLWDQIIRFACAAQRTNNLTAAAHDAGFCDAAHMNRTFRNFVGINPGRVLHNLDGFTVRR
ncbi:MAG: helix-turn-helix transcriptional regulator [Parvularculaceae bacterium]|nr:helix-turn-helix transcriptional regulator [Parvularculaceae bacterium]